MSKQSTYRFGSIKTKPVRWSEQELAIAFEAGVADHRAGLKRKSNPFQLTPAKRAWEKGWHHDQIEQRKETRQKWRARRKAKKEREKAKKNTSPQGAGLGKGGEA